METPVPESAPKHLHTSTYAPHPLLIWSPLHGGLRYPGDKLHLGASLIGDAAHLIPHLIAALARMAQLGLGKGRGKLGLIRVDDTCSGKPIWHQDTDRLDLQHISPDALSLEPQPHHADLPDLQELRIELLSPLQLRRAGNFMNKLTFADLIAACADRFATLLACYADTPDAHAHPHIDPAAWRRRAEQADIHLVEDTTSRISVERYSARQQVHHDLIGLVGSLTFRGDLRPFLPILHLGARLQIGRKPSMGLGRIHLALVEASPRL
jgi:hypothetical protein